MARKFSLAYLTIPGVEAVDQIKIAAEAGYDYVSLRTIPMGQPGEPQNILERDPALYKKIQQTLKDYDMKMLDIELVRIKEGLPCDFRGAFEKGAALGATDVLSSVWTEDRNLAIESYGKICEQAQEFGLTVNFEFPRLAGIRTLKDTLAVRDAVGAANLKILMDMLYVHWDKVTGEDIKKIDPNKFGVIHLCDSPKDEATREIVEIMREGREYCGLGAANLPDILQALPANNCSIELPNSKYIKEYGAAGHAKRCLEHAKEVFAQAGL